MKPGDALKGRSLLTLDDVSDKEFLYLVDLSLELKKSRSSGIKGHRLDRKNIALLFEKSSTRTRCAAAVAVADEGGCTEYLSSADSHLGKKESVADTARVLGRMFDGIMFRGYDQETVELLAEHSGVPVWNGLTDGAHPTQALADLVTVKERFGRLRGLKLVYVGDGRNNVANSLMRGCAKTGIHFVNCTPKELSPSPDLLKESAEVAGEVGGSVSVEHEPRQAVKGADVVYTDVWISMGEEAKKEERLKLLKPYQVNMGLMEKTGNLYGEDVMFLHCLPAYHDNNTEFTKDIGALEVTDDVFESPVSKVFDQAENKMHAAKALIVSTVG